MVQHQALISYINKEFNLEIREKDFDQLKLVLSEEINRLILNDLPKLINLLYRIDISEARLKQMLLENSDQEAGKIMADLIIERQMKKIKTREEFKSPSADTDENEKW